MNANSDGQTLKRAVAGEPTASWTDNTGQLWTTDEVLRGWPSNKLDAPVTWSEGRMSMPEIRAQDGSFTLTMLPPTGLGVSSEPPVEPES